MLDPHDSTKQAVFNIANVSSGSTQTIDVTTLGGGVTVIGDIDGQAPSDNGATISGADLYLQSASETKPGLVSTTAQTFAGTKTFPTPIGISPGTVLVSPVSGAIENDGTNLFYTDRNDVRWSLVPQNNVSGAVISVNSSGGAPSNYLQVSDPNAGDVWDIDGTGQLSWQAAGGALSPTYVLEMNGGRSNT